MNMRFVAYRNLLILLLFFILNDSLAFKMTRLDTLVRMNAKAEKVIRWTLNENSLLRFAGLYANDELEVTEIQVYHKKNKVLVYLDSNHREILLRYSLDEGKTTVDTYTVRDQNGRINYILPPAFCSAFTKGGPIQELIDHFTFQYRYSSNHESYVSKKLPSSDWIHFIYNENDQLVLSSGWNKNQWDFNKFDEKGRVIYSGQFKSRLPVKKLREIVANGDMFFESKNSNAEFPYSLDKSFPKVKMKDINEVRIYDDYSFVKNVNHVYERYEGFSEKSLLNIGDKPTIELKKVRPTRNFLQYVNYYDLNGRKIQVTSDNVYGGVDRYSKSYSKDNSYIAKTKLVHYGSDSVVLNNEYKLSDKGAEYWSQIDDQRQELVKTLGSYYDKDRYIHTYFFSGGGRIYYNFESCGMQNDFLEGIDFYKPEEGLLRVQFSYEPRNVVNYHEGTINTSKAIFLLRNTSERIFLATNEYKSDLLNRLSTSELKVESLSDTTFYSLTDLSYDDNGNIKALKRKKNEALVDELTYRYEGNRLMLVKENGDMNQGFSHGQNVKYVYDSKGGLIEMKGGSKMNFSRDALGYVSGIYTNMGETSFWMEQGKILRMISNSNGLNRTITKIGNDFWDEKIIYRNGKIRLIIGSDDELIVKKTTESNYRFYTVIRDNVGRVLAIVDDNFKLVELNCYEPFGGKMQLISIFDELNLFDSSTIFDGMGLLNFGDRVYDPKIGRFLSPNAISVLEQNHSPYQYGLNNPVSNSVPTGSKALPLRVN